MPAKEAEALSVHKVVREHHGSLLVWLRRRLAVPEDANDIAQEAYIRLMKYEGSTEIRSPLSMLYRIALNVAHDLGRAGHARRNDEHLNVDDMELPSEQPEVERVLDAKASYRRACDAIEQLPPKCRQVFLLSRVRGMTYPEIARHCGISVKMVEKHISHALLVCMQQTWQMPVQKSTQDKPPR